MGRSEAEERRDAAELGPDEAAAWREPLCAWYAAERRDLPWRRTTDAYRVWISEAMLQQTRVEVVLPYYARFLERFPTLDALAAAREEDVVAAWSGLGYYRRARALRAAARAMLDEHGGRFPRERSAALALPGIGAYTAAAVLSIAYGRSEPLVDGNVARVFARAFALESPLGSSELARRCGALAARLMPPAAESAATGATSPGTWNQALMELGALVCTPRSPRCSACPWAPRCRAKARGLVEELPRKAARRTPLDVRLEVGVARRGADVLLVRRPEAGRMARMWELPTRELPNGEGRTHLWPAELPPPAQGLQLGEELARVSHSITHHRIRVSVRRAELQQAPSTSGATSCWADAAEREALGLTGMTRKILGRVLGAAAEPRLFG